MCQRQKDVSSAKRCVNGKKMCHRQKDVSMAKRCVIGKKMCHRQKDVSSAKILHIEVNLSGRVVNIN